MLTGSALAKLNWNLLSTVTIQTSRINLGSTFLPKFRNYSNYCVNHPSNPHRGDSTVIIKSSLPHHNLNAYTTSSIQSAIVAVRLNRYNVIVRSLYYTPRCIPNDTKFINFFTNLWLKKYCWRGDFNSKHSKHSVWSSLLTSSRSRFVQRARN